MVPESAMDMMTPNVPKDLDGHAAILSGEAKATGCVRG